MKPTHAIVTAAIHDMNGFANLGQISVAEYEAAEEGPDHNETADICYLLDLHTKYDIEDNKHATAETAAALLGWPVEEIAQRARQRLAQINDEDEEYLRTRRSDSAPVESDDA